MKSKVTWIICLGLLLLLKTGTAGAVSIYNSTSQFSSASNPAGVWSYGWMPTDFSSFNLYPDMRLITSVNNSPAWYDKALGTEPVIWKNESSGAIWGVSPGEVSLHPGSSGQASVIRFTAPFAGLADISAIFSAGDGAAMNVGVRNSSGFLWTASDAGSWLSMDYSFAPLDTIDFVVWGGYYYGNTPLDVTISLEKRTVPEPSTLLLLASGVGGMAVFRRRYAS